MNSYEYDLFVLVAYKNMESFVNSLLGRHADLGCNEIQCKVARHPEKDSGCYEKAHEFLQPFHGQFEHALVIFDEQFDRAKPKRGRKKSATKIQNEVTQRLSANGWEDRAKAIVIDPELENWMRGDCPALEIAIRWNIPNTDVRSWLSAKELWPVNKPKPPDPKSALETVLKSVGRPRSSVLYKDTAKMANLENCRDSSFAEFKQTLNEWFPIKTNE